MTFVWGRQEEKRRSGAEQLKTSGLFWTSQRAARMATLNPVSKIKLSKCWVEAAVQHLLPCGKPLLSVYLILALSRWNVRTIKRMLKWCSSSSENKFPPPSLPAISAEQTELWQLWDWCFLLLLLGDIWAEFVCPCWGIQKHRLGYHCFNAAEVGCLVTWNSAPWENTYSLEVSMV